MKKTAYIVQWWNANGDCMQSEKMSQESAAAFAASMNPDQDAQIILVCA